MISRYEVSAFIQERPQLGVVDLRGEELVVSRVGLAVRVGVGEAVHRRDVERAVRDLDLLDLAVADKVEKFVVADLAGALRQLLRVHRREEVVEADGQHQRPDEQRQHAPAAIVVLVAFILVVLIHVSAFLSACGPARAQATACQVIYMVF